MTESIVETHKVNDPEPQPHEIIEIISPPAKPLPFTPELPEETYSLPLWLLPQSNHHCTS